MEPIVSRIAMPAIAPLRDGAATSKVAGTGFNDALGSALDRISTMQGEASQLSREFQLETSTVSLEETMIALNKASLGFQAAVQVRNKLVAAYNEIMNMPV